MDINSQQQINTFVGGMNTDTSDALLDSNQYRYAENLRIVTNTDSNSGELRIIDGIQTLIDKYINKDTDSKHWDEILYMTSVRQYLILITKDINKQTNIAGWSIYRWEEGKDDLKCIFGPCGEAIWDESGNTNLSVVTRYESEQNIKMYIADGIHQIMCINICNVENPAPTDFSYVYEYQSVVLPKLSVEVSSTDGGQLKAAKVQYAYRLYKKYGNSTTLSPLSKILSLYKDSSSGYEQNAQTGRAVSISVPSFSTNNLDSIQIFRINYIENGQFPSVNLIVDDKIEAIEDQNNILLDIGKDINSVSTSEFLSYIQLKVIPKSIETKNNYLFSANVTYKESDVNEVFKDVAQNLESYFEITPRVDTNSPYIIGDSNQDSSYSDQIASFRPGETYRFGIVLYDNNGNKTSVFPFKNDLQMPDYSDSAMDDWCEIKNSEPWTNPTYIVRPLTVTVEQKQEILNCKYYEVVRCIRTINDKKTISQGLLGRPMELFSKSGNSWKSTHKLTPSGFITMNQFYILPVDNDSSAYGKLSSDVLQFASPEYAYQSDDMQELIKQYGNSLSLNIVSEYVPRIKKVNNFLYTTYYNSNTQTIQPQLRMHWMDGDVESAKKNAYDSEINQTSSYIYSDSDYSRNVSMFEYGFEFNKNGKTGVIKFNTIMPTYKAKSARQSYDIQSYSFPVVPEFNDVAKQDDIRLRDDVTTIDEYQYTSWSNPFIPNFDSAQMNALKDRWKNGEDPSYPVGYNGPLILFKTSTQIDPNVYDTPKEGGVPEQTTEAYWNPSSLGEPATITSAYGPLVITVADLRKQSTPYGGDSEYSKNNSTYYSFGDIFESSSTRWQHTITSGDCYIRLFKYGALHNWYDTTYVTATKMGTVYEVPIFSDIDLKAQFGDLYNRNLQMGYYIQNKASAFDNYVQKKDSYLYNTAYNSHPDIVGHSTYKKDSVENTKYDTRVHYSEQKTNNELIDNWTQFKSMNFLEVDSSFGQITDLKLFKDRLIFWQEHATGILAVNERVILQDANNTQVVLGTGSVLDRYDYISTTHGMKPEQHSSCVSDDYLYWWDGYNKEILQYAEKYSATPLSQVKNIRNYINQNEESNKPHIYYNRKYKEVGCQCLKNGNNSNGEVIAYNELLQRFTSVYTARNIDRSINYGFAPIYDTYLNGNLLITDGNSVYKQSQNEETSHLFNSLYVQPYLKYIVNTNNTLGKTYDIQIIGGNLYNSKDEALTVDSKLDVIDFEKVQRFQNQPSLKDEPYNHQYHTTEHLKSLQLRYTTPLKQEGVIKDGKGITNREYDYRLNIPRETGNDVYGGRLRGKTMQCELWSTSSSTDFSLQYITTKYRMSWS